LHSLALINTKEVKKKIKTNKNKISFFILFKYNI
jgi:hypothetical protein